jgi:hypothetical protein
MEACSKLTVPGLTSNKLDQSPKKIQKSDSFVSNLLKGHEDISDGRFNDLTYEIGEPAVRRNARVILT